MSQHRLHRRPIRRLAAAAVGVAAVVGVGFAGTASATAPKPDMTGMSTATTKPIPGLNRGESATFRVRDTGTAIAIRGEGSGMAGARKYISLVYADPKCSVPEPVAGLTLDGAWQSTGRGHEELEARFTGDAYLAVKGHIGSISVREITAAVNNGDGTFSLTATARACATLSTGR